MSEEKLSYGELKAAYEVLQKQVTHSLYIKQELIHAKTSLDRDLTRLMQLPYGHDHFQMDVLHVGLSDRSQGFHRLPDLLPDTPS